MNKLNTERKNKHLIVTNAEREEYSGVYEGKIDVMISPTGYELVEGWIAFDFTDNNSVVLYDGLFFEDYKLENDEVKSIIEADSKGFSGVGTTGFGYFGEMNKQKGFYIEYNEEESDTCTVKKSFLRKTGDVKTAKAKIKYYKDEMSLFDIFYLEFKRELLNKDFNKLGNYGKFPLVDETNNAQIKNSTQLGNILRLSFNDNFFKEQYNIMGLDNIPYRYEDHYPGKEGIYMLQTSALFISFKKIGDSFKVVTISHPYN
ncbi:MAG: hypothetical protein NTY74_14320 [Ignavibacteriae bacterium]|nr:hypothetical protein [Ignavibacteriota bacterium]